MIYSRNRFSLMLGIVIASVLLLLHNMDYDTHSGHTKDVGIRRFKFPTHENQLPVLLTGFGDNHFDEGQGLIQSIHQYLPNYTFIVYDFGLEHLQRQRLLKYCRCEVRQFDVSKYPRHAGDLRTYAFKPLLVTEVLEDYGFVFWVDASIRFLSSNVSHLWQLARTTGFAASEGVYPISCTTHPSMFIYMNISDISTFRVTNEVQATFLLFYALPETMALIVYPWRQCALDPACITPDGPRKETCNLKLRPHYCNCNRQDQSALNLILFGKCREQCTTNNGRRIRGHLGVVFSLSPPYNILHVERDRAVQYFPLA